MMGEISVIRIIQTVCSLSVIIQHISRIFLTFNEVACQHLHSPRSLSAMPKIRRSDPRIFSKLLRHVFWEGIDTLLPSAATCSIVLTTPQHICAALLSYLWPRYPCIGSRTLASTRWCAKLLENLVDDRRIHSRDRQHRECLH